MSGSESKLKNILWIGLLAGTLDALAALLSNLKTPPAVIFKYIASAVFGKAAFAGGTEMVIAGVVFHYLIAYLFIAAFYIAYPRFIAVFRFKILVAVVYGAITWLVMNLVVVPLTKIGPHAMQLKGIITGMAILILCIGLPAAIGAGRSHRK